MELDEMKNLWQQQDNEKAANGKLEIRNLVDNKMSSLEKEITSRNRREIIVAIALIAFFSYVLFISQLLWTQLGCVILIVSSLYICYKLKSAEIEKISDETSFNRSLKEHLKWELKQVQRQKSLIENIAWWYIGPITVGLVFLTIGFKSGLQFKIIYLSIVAVLGVAVWILNQRAVKHRFKPLIREIREAIEFIKE